MEANKLVMTIDQDNPIEIMGSELAEVKPAPSTPVQAGPAAWWEDREQIQLLKDTAFKGFTDAEVQFSLAICKARNLNPILKEIHFRKQYDAKLKREAIVSIVGIDGFRKKAEESGEYEGQTKPEWCGQDGVWHDVWVRQAREDGKFDEYPHAARVGIYRKGFREPVYGVAHFAEYAQTYYDKEKGKTVLSPMWLKMYAGQLSKCAEALAHRKAFPRQLSGIYSPEEMAQAGNEATK